MFLPANTARAKLNLRRELSLRNHAVYGRATETSGFLDVRESKYSFMHLARYSFGKTESRLHMRSSDVIANAIAKAMFFS